MGIAEEEGKGRKGSGMEMLLANPSQLRVNLTRYE